MKISLKLANGATLEFEGDQTEFDRISAFLAQPPDSLTAEAKSSREPEQSPGKTKVAPKGSLEPEVVWERIEQVEALNDQQRVTVMAQLAIESGKAGIDYETVNRLYTELGFAKPAQFPTKTFSNAKGSGLVQLVKPGLWKPTFKGENFARGLGRGERVSSRAASRPATSSNGGGEPD